MAVAIYARKSTDQAGVVEEAKSVTRQIEHAKDYARGKGWSVVDDYVYVDDGISGAEFAKRPGFLRLMNALKPSPPFQVLIMSEESRLGRESIDRSRRVASRDAARPLVPRLHGRRLVEPSRATKKSGRAEAVSVVPRSEVPPPKARRLTCR